MKRTAIFSLTCLLAVALLLGGCDLLTNPFPGEGYRETIVCYPATGEGSMIRPMPPETIPNYGTELVTEIFVETTPVEPDPVTAWGCIRGCTADGLLQIRLSGTYKGERNVMVYVQVENADGFSVYDEVSFVYDANRPVETMPTGEDILVAESMEYIPVAVPEKPVIYLYPETPTEVSVKLTVDGELTCTYPSYDKGWDNFTAHPDGTLVFPDGKQYYCLYWEGIQNMDCDFSKGFCVKGEDTAEFLEWALAEQGLTPREANEFIIYWLPRMEQNPYNVIAFQTEAYTEGAVLEIAPNPDSLLRVFMAYYPSDEAVEMEAQVFTPFERIGFAVVEWGGCEVVRP